MRVCAVVVLTSLLTGFLSVPCRAEPSGPATAPVKERLNSLSPGEAARAARSRARALQAANPTPVAARPRMARKDRPAVTAEAKPIPRERTPEKIARAIKFERRHVARIELSREARRQDHRLDRRHYAEEAAPRLRPGDRVPRYVRLYRLPARYAYAPPPYPNPYMRPIRRPFLFGFFYPHPTYEAFGED